MKRLLIIVISIIYFNKTIIYSNAFGIFLALFGFSMYQHIHKNNNRKKLYYRLSQKYDINKINNINNIDSKHNNDINVNINNNNSTIIDKNNNNINVISINNNNNDKSLLSQSMLSDISDDSASTSMNVMIVNRIEDIIETQSSNFINKHGSNLISRDKIKTNK